MRLIRTLESKACVDDRQHATPVDDPDPRGSELGQWDDLDRYTVNVSNREVIARLDQQHRLAGRPLYPEIDQA